MRSSSGRPDAWYFLAIDTTSRRFDWTNALLGGPPKLTLLGSCHFLAGRIQIDDCRLTGFDQFRQPDLIILGEERVLPDIGQVQANQILFIAINAILGHGCSSRFE